MVAKILENIEKTKKRYHIQPTVFTKGITFKAFYEDLDNIMEVTLNDLKPFKKCSGFVKKMTNLLRTLFCKLKQGTSPICIVDVRRKIFHIKTETCWCNEMHYNKREFKQLINSVMLHLHKACISLHAAQPEIFPVIASCDIINNLTKCTSGDGDAVAEKIMNKFIISYKN